MEWTEGIRKTISYIEKHLLEDTSLQNIADEVGISNFYLQKGFKLMTGCSMAEYIKNRRLYLAALDVIADRDKVIDLSYKYGYRTPESFTKAFARFHGSPPRELKKNPAQIRTFLPLKIKISIQGGYDMDCGIEKMKGFKVAGIQREFAFETAYAEIPKFWNELTGKTMEAAEYGVSIDDLDSGDSFRYLIGRAYTKGPVPEGVTVYELPDMLWAKFSCKGPHPEALQSINTKIYSEWLPGNAEYEIAIGVSIERYNRGVASDPDYESEIWIPVKRKS